MQALKKWFSKEKSFQISKEEYLLLLKNKIPHILIDVRREEEYQEKHMKNAKLLPIHLVESHIERFYPNKDDIYILYCRSGIRSQSALNLMLSLGYRKVYNLGGIIDDL
jgi:phage shock protein E